VIRVVRTIYRSENSSFLTDFYLQKKEVYDAGSVPNILGTLFDRKGFLKSSDFCCRKKSNFSIFQDEPTKKQAKPLLPVHLV